MDGGLELLFLFAHVLEVEGHEAAGVVIEVLQARVWYCSAQVVQGAVDFGVGCRHAPRELGRVRLEQG
jgi:hypothetical protein